MEGYGEVWKMKELSRIFHGSLVYNLYTVEYSRTLIICKEPTKVLENSYDAYK